ncbi:helix-turn-helix domain-containing protein [Cryobacterium sp. TmT2-59]|nr:helix-turn-helix domain-containing protein [Cryobacterium sp. TmT2-59]
MRPINAAKRVGIGRTTDPRRRSQRGGIAPLRLAEADRHDRYLRLIERERIALFSREGHPIRDISRRLGRSPSTISRELHRNMRECTTPGRNRGRTRTYSASQVFGATHGPLVPVEWFPRALSHTFRIDACTFMHRLLRRERPRWVEVCR